MTVRRLTSLAAGLGLLTLAFGFLLAMVSLLLNGPATNTLIGAGILVVFGNLTAASTFGGLFVLDDRADRKSFGIRNFTPAGMGLVAVTSNVMAGVAIGAPPEYVSLLFSPRAAALLIGLPVFFVGWFLLSRFGFPVLQSTTPDRN